MKKNKRKGETKDEGGHGEGGVQSWKFAGYQGSSEIMKRKGMNHNIGNLQ